MVTSIKYELIVITDLDFDNPTGAGYRRIMCYVKALSGPNVLIKIISSKYRYKNGFSSNTISKNLTLLKGVQKLDYKTTFEDFHFLSIFRFLKESEAVLKSGSAERTFKVYFLYNSTFVLTLECLLYHKLFNRHRIIIEKNELEIGIELNKPDGGNNLAKRLILFLLKIFLTVPSIISDVLPVFFNGMIVISTGLYRIYQPVKKKIISIPILADPETFQKNYTEGTDKTVNLFKIGYFGNISEKKDGLFSLIESVISTKNTDIELYIFGTGSTDDLLRLKKILIKFSQIQYFGLIYADQVPEKLVEVDLLAFPRPKNLQTKYGFSTKLAEFLLSKTPVLTSDVSDNKLFLRDNENAFIIKSQKLISTELLTNKIISIYNMPKKELIKIGYNGYLTACSSFNPSTYSAILKHFIFDDHA